MKKPLVVIGMLGTKLDAPRKNRWTSWRPTMSLLGHQDLLVDKLVLLHQAKFTPLAETICEDAASVSPETEVQLENIEFRDAWNFEDVYSALYSFAERYPFDPAREDYLIHMTTGTHVAQICLYLLTEARYFPGRLIQSSPPTGRHGAHYSLIDLDLSRYDKLASRFAARTESDLHFLKDGIKTENSKFNHIIERIEKIALLSTAPMLLTGETGVGKSQLARRIFALQKSRNIVSGELVEVNCATLRGDGAMSTLFGHKKGAFTGALSDRPGLLRMANEGTLFLDEIGELGLDEQAMLLRAIEEKRFLPMGSDKEVSSHFQLIAGTNRDLRAQVKRGRFREDLLARIDMWSFGLPPLRHRPEDIEPNLDYELRAAEERRGHRVRFNKEARALFLRFALRHDWPGNFRDFHAAIERMSTLAGRHRIDEALVREEVGRHVEDSALPEAIDLFDKAQLETVIAVCRRSKSLSAAGRQLFAVSRLQKKSSNDADRLRKYLARFGVDFTTISQND